MAKLNLNECLLMKLAYASSEISMGMKRAVRPFIKAINKKANEHKEDYTKIFENLNKENEGKDLSKEEQNVFFNKIDKGMAEFNENIYPEINWERKSSKTFVFQIWSSFRWDPKKYGPDFMEIIDRVDEKLVEIYPDLDIDIDKEEETTKDNVVEEKAE